MIVQAMRGQIRSLQVLRCIAALGVVASHALYLDRPFGHASALWPGHLTGLGLVGVDIFFVLSGSIIYLTAFDEPRLTAGAFIHRRLTRIVPMYFLVSAAWIPFLAVFARPGQVLDWRALLATFAFWPATDRMIVPILSVGWTLCFEMLFYMAAAVMLASRAFGRALLAAFVLATVVSQLLVFGLIPERVAVWLRPVQFTGNLMSCEFLLGIFVAQTCRFERAPIWAITLLLTMGVAWIVILCPINAVLEPSFALSGVSSWARLLFWGLPAALILAAALMVEPRLRGEWLRVPIFLGDASYAIYLIHWPVITLLVWAIRHFATWATAHWLLEPVLFVSGVVAGSLLHVAVEKPLISGARRLFRPIVAPGVAAAT